MLRHADTCPSAVAEDATSARDSDWFAQHPLARTRRRPVEPGDFPAIRRLRPSAPDGRWVGEVIVVQIEPGVRVRTFGEVELEVSA